MFIINCGIPTTLVINITVVIGIHFTTVTILHGTLRYTIKHMIYNNVYTYYAIVVISKLPENLPINCRVPI